MTNNKKDQIKKIKDFSFAVRKNILEMAFAAGASSSHFGGALSIADIVSVLFSYQMKINSKDPKWKDRDRFILSKGHACLAYYAALCEVGYISKDELSTFEKDETNLFASSLFIGPIIKLKEESIFSEVYSISIPNSFNIICISSKFLKL